MQEPSIFTRILQGDIKQEIIYQDEQCFVITSHEPISSGHIIVIPIKQTDSLWDIEDPLYSHLFEIAKQMTQKLRKIYRYERIASIVDGHGVPHAHIHLFGINAPLEEVMSHHETHKYIATAEELAIEADRLRSA